MNVQFQITFKMPDLPSRSNIQNSVASRLHPIQTKEMNESILIVDDEIYLANGCAQILKRAGFTCLIAYDGPTALSLFDSHQPALVISDVNLGESSGFEIVEYVYEKSPITPIILMTGSRKVLEDELPVGVASYLRKPFSTSDLISSVKSLLRAKDAKPI
jgi:DNA-binding response OmpR family regulator